MTDIKKDGDDKKSSPYPLKDVEILKENTTQHFANAENIPHHTCGWCGMNFICNIVTNGKICKDLMNYCTWVQGDNTEVLMTYYFCDFICRDKYLDEKFGGRSEIATPNPQESLKKS